MKLKKIASLMLAGVMAVSMLAGCSGKGNNSGNKDDQNQVVAASVADYANSLMSDSQKNVFKFKNSSELTAALQKVAGDSTKFKSSEIKTVYDAIKTTITDTQGNKDMTDALKDEMKLDQYGNEMAAQKDTHTAGYMYQVSGKLTQASAVQLIVKNFVEYVFVNDYFPATGNGVKCDYSAEISAVKVTAPDDSGNSAWVVAIVVTQTGVETNNA